MNARTAAGVFVVACVAPLACISLGCASVIQPRAPEPRPEVVRAPEPNRMVSGLGSATEPLKVSLVSFHGYAPAFASNGGALRTQPESIADQYGVTVDYIMQDNVPTLTEIFTTGAAHCSWRTSDFWAQEQPNLRRAGLDARAVMVTANSRGADALITLDPSIQSVRDLVNKSVALLMFTPSHGLLLDAIERSDLTPVERDAIDIRYINVDEGTSGVRAALGARLVDAAFLWDPDASIAVRTMGARVVYSTRAEVDRIFDVIVCDTRVLDNPANHPAISALVAAWTDGVAAIRENPMRGVAALVEANEFYQQLAREHGRDFIAGLFSNLVLADVAENRRVFGLDGGANHYAASYRRFDRIYRRAGSLANPSSPVIDVSESVDLRFIRALR
ncbi:MAG: hypothetical protein AAF411_25170 [Myxococcota bacterium]